MPTAATHEVLNQSTPLAGHHVYGTDRVGHRLDTVEVFGSLPADIDVDSIIRRAMLA